MNATVLDAAGQMALDEAVLAAAPPDSLVLRVYRWPGTACTFGYSQPFRAARAACDARGWRAVAPVRRATGGGIVYHDGDVTFSLVFPWDRACAPEAIYKNVHRAVHLGLKEAGAGSALFSPQKRELGAAAACFSRAEPMDLVVDDGRKLLGGALRKRGGRGLYQGSLRPELVALPRAAVESAIAVGVAREFGRPATLDMAEEWRASGRELESRYRSREWNERR